MIERLILCFWLAVLLVCHVPSAFAATAVVHGKVSVGGTGVSGVNVKAYPFSAMGLGGAGAIISSPSVADGTFTLSLAPGQYYFLAEGGELFTYYGRNPVTVPAEGLNGLNMSLVKEKPEGPPGEPLVEEGILGRVNYRGRPLAGAIVTIYTDLTSQLKGRGLGMTAPSDETGYVEAPLPPGTYYLVARMRQSGQFSGPLSAGDYFGYYAGNPLVIQAGEVARVGIDLVVVPQKVARLAGSMFGQTHVRGRILNAVGSAVAGVRVLLYADSMMLNRPLYVSQPSNDKGEYVLSFPKGGTYFLAARNKLGGAPGPGELYGRYLGSQDSSIKIRTGQGLKGIDLLVEEMW